MNDLNEVVIIGRLTRDAEMKYTPNGVPVSNISIASNRSRKQGDQWISEVHYFEVAYWGKGAESVQPYLTKGQQIAVSGHLSQDRWTQDGQNRSKVKVTAEAVQLVGGHAQREGQGEAQQPPDDRRPANASADARKTPPSDGGYYKGPVGKPAADEFEDDLPF